MTAVNNSDLVWIEREGFAGYLPRPGSGWTPWRLVDHPDPDVDARACALRDLVAEDLGITPPRVQWMRALQPGEPFDPGADFFLQHRPETLAGTAQLEANGLRLVVGNAERAPLVRVVAHEMAHLAGIADEDEADAYALALCERLGVNKALPPMLRSQCDG